jgi:hypothetical protein
MSTLLKHALRSNWHSHVLRGFGVFLVALFVIAPRQVVQGQTANEYQIKAAFILNFAKFVDWPNGAFQNGNLVVGIVGTDPFGEEIDRLLKGNQANGRPLIVRRLKRTDNLRVCNILFISSSEQKHLGQIMQSLKGASVLTVGEMSQFAREGGMIRLLIEGHKVRFEINSTAASEAGLKISSKLMALSRGGAR